MLYKLNNSKRSPAIKPIKSWLNLLVIPNPNLIENDVYDENMRLAVRQFQIRNGSPNPHGIIDNITLYNILVRTNAKRIDDALSRNTAFKMLTSTLAMVYDDEVHRNLTFALALAAGFHFPNATEISGYDVGVDYDPDTQPMPNGAKDVASGNNYQRLKDWHFVTPERLSQLNNVWRSSGSLKDLGMYMHTFQDSFSHKGLGPKLGQIGTRVDENGEVQRDSRHKKDWHQVDDPSKRPELAVDMAKQSYDTLVEAVPICLQKDPQRLVIRKTYVAIQWADIAQEISSFCKEPNADQRIVKADQLGTRLFQYQLKMKER